MSQDLGKAWNFFYKAASLLGSFIPTSEEETTEEYDEVEEQEEEIVDESIDKKSEEDVDEFAKQREEWRLRFEPLELRANELKKRITTTAFEPIDRLLSDLQRSEANDSFEATSGLFESLESLLKEVAEQFDGARKVYESTVGDATNLFEKLKLHPKAPAELLSKIESLIVGAKKFYEEHDTVNASELLDQGLQAAKGLQDQLTLAENIVNRGNYSEEIKPRRDRCLKIWKDLSKENQERLDAKFKTLELRYQDDDYTATAGLIVELDNSIDEIEFVLPKVVKAREGCHSKFEELDKRKQSLKDEVPILAFSKIDERIREYEGHFEKYQFDDAQYCLGLIDKELTSVKSRFDEARKRYKQVVQKVVEVLNSIKKQSQAEASTIEAIENLLKQVEQAEVPHDSIAALDLSEQALEKAQEEQKRVELLLELARGEHDKQVEVRQLRLDKIVACLSPEQKLDIDQRLVSLKSMRETGTLEDKALVFQKLDGLLLSGEQNMSAKPDCSLCLERIEKRLIEVKQIPVADEKLESPLSALKQAKLLASQCEFAAGLKQLDGVESAINKIADEEEKRLLLAPFENSKCKKLVEGIIAQGGTSALKELKVKLNGDLSSLEVGFEIASKSQASEKKKILDREFPKPDGALSGMATKQRNRQIEERSEELDEKNESALSGLSVSVAQTYAQCGGLIKPSEFQVLLTALDQKLAGELLKSVKITELRSSIDSLTMKRFCEFADACGTASTLNAILDLAGGGANLKQLAKVGFDGYGISGLLKAMKFSNAMLIIEHGLSIGSDLRDYWTVLGKKSESELEWCLGFAGEKFFRVLCECLEKNKVADMQAIFDHEGSQEIVEFDKGLLCNQVRFHGSSKIKNILELTKDIERDENTLQDMLSWGVTKHDSSFDLVRLESNLKSLNTAIVDVQKNSKIYKGGSTKTVTAMTGFLRVAFGGTDTFDIHIHWIADDKPSHQITSMHVCPLGGSKGGYECQNMSQFKLTNEAVVTAINDYGVTAGPVHL